MQCSNADVQSTLPSVVGDVSRFQLSQSYARDRLLESGQFDSVTISCAANSGHWLFFPCFFSFEMQKNSGQPKDEKSCGRETRPTSVEKMAMLEEIQAWVSRCIFVLAAVSWSINQSINQSNDQSINQPIVNWKGLREFTLEILPTVFIWPKQMFWCYVLWSVYFIIYVRRMKERK